MGMEVREEGNRCPFRLGGLGGVGGCEFEGRMEGHSYEAGMSKPSKGCYEHLDCTTHCVSRYDRTL